MRTRITRFAALLVLAASAVLADEVVVQLTQCNDAICALGLGSPFGTVTKTLVDNSGNPISSGSGNILVQLALFDGLVLINKGLAFNSGVTLSVGSVTGITPSANYGPLNTAGTPMDGFTTGQAKFQYNIPGPNGLSDPNASSTLTFTVIGSFSTVEIIDQPNGRGFEWAAEVGKPNCGAPRGACTGYIANGTSVVPEPGTVALFVVGLLGVGVVRRSGFTTSRSR